eukprot:6344880-Amphidinium_carterae.1
MGIQFLRPSIARLFSGGPERVSPRLLYDVVDSGHETNCMRFAVGMPCAVAQVGAGQYPTQTPAIARCSLIEAVVHADEPHHLLIPGGIRALHRRLGFLLFEEVVLQNSCYTHRKCGGPAASSPSATTMQRYVQ